MDASAEPVSETLLGWYDRHGRSLPWRARPGEPAPDPYRVWLSEVMLQQTTTAAVGPYFAEFTRRWPDVQALAAESKRLKADRIAAVDARGFILGGAVAYETHTPFALVRKKGKLPFKTVATDYALEYGSATIEIHADACQPGDRVIIVDDLIATGGTLLAAAALFRQLSGEIAGVAAVIDLPGLGGSAKLRAAGLTVHTLCEFSEHE